MNSYVDRTLPALNFVDIGIALLDDAHATVHQILGTPEDLEALLLTDYRMRGRRSLKDLPRVLARHQRSFAGWTALAITPAAIREYITGRLDAGAKPATVNKELNALSRMRRLAMLEAGLPPQPPVPKLPTDNARRGFLDPGEFEAFSAELPEYLQPFARFAYLTGWRKEEVLTLQWSQVELAGGTLRLENDQTKTGQGRIYVFAPDDPADEMAQLLHGLHERRRLDCSFLFHRNGRRIRDYYHAWRSAAERAGRTGLHLHDFRRSTARNLDRAGVPTGVAMTVMGHKTRRIFDRYNITSEGDLREATAKLSAYLANRRTAPLKTVPLRPRKKQPGSTRVAEPAKNRQSRAR